MFHIAVIQFELCRISAGLRVNRPRKSGTNTRRSRSAEHLPLCAAITTIDIAPPATATTAEGIFALETRCVIALGFVGTVNTDNVDPLLPVHRLYYQA